MAHTKENQDHEDRTWLVMTPFLNLFSALMFLSLALALIFGWTYFFSITGFTAEHPTLASVIPAMSGLYFVLRFTNDLREAINGFFRWFNR